MDGSAKPRKQKHLFPLTGLFTCGVCGYAVTAEKQKGYTYYHCTNGKGICDQKKLFIREEKLDEQLAPIFDDVAFDEELIEMMYQAALEQMEHDDQFNTAAIEKLEKELAAIKLKDNRLLDAFLAENIEKDIYDAKQAEIKHERIALEKQLAGMRQNHQNPYATIERAKELFLFSNRAKSEYANAVPERKQEIAYELLSNALLKDRKMAQPQLKSPYDMLARTPKNADFAIMCG
ncbi:recombinase zinc beta ribbon domain-containing protein [Candidatus Nomurabacteria bacterium]|nr:recombinase zinc beta ribbon domain-containing protein [Candidatus Nomurabacteria bacterium]